MHKALHPKIFHYILSTDRALLSEEASREATFKKIESQLQSGKEKIDMHPLDVFFLKPVSVGNQSAWSYRNIMKQTEEARLLGAQVTSPEQALFQKLTKKKIDHDEFLKEASKFVKQYISNASNKHDLIFSVDPRLYLSPSEDGQSLLGSLTAEEKKALSRNLFYLERVAESFKKSPDVFKGVQKTLGVPHPVDRVFLVLSKNPYLEEIPLSTILKTCDASVQEFQLPEANLSNVLRKLKTTNDVEGFMQLLSTRLAEIINRDFKLAENYNAELFRNQHNQLSALMSSNWPELIDRVLPQLSKVPRYYAKSINKSGITNEQLLLPEVLKLSDYVAVIKNEESSLIDRLQALADMQCFYPEKWQEYCDAPFNQYFLNGILIELSDSLFLLPRAPAAFTQELRTQLLKES